MWGRSWDPLLAHDSDGALVHVMNTTPDGDFQTYKSESGGVHPRALLRPRPANRGRWSSEWTDDQIWSLQRGGHDYRKLYGAYLSAQSTRGSRR